MAFDQFDHPTSAWLGVSPSNTWLYPYNSRGDTATLQEPGPFEDFEYGFGFHNHLLPFSLDADALLNVAEEPPQSSEKDHEVLNEDDQRAFSQFLDTFCIDQQSSPLMDTNLPLAFPESPLPSTTFPFPSPLKKTLVPLRQPDTHDHDEQRRSTILQSLDKEKQRLERRTESDSTDSAGDEWRAPTTSKKRRASVSIAGTAVDLHVTKQGKVCKELLTEEEKRVNHIASEQKRRTTIRSGFKDLADIVPSTKHINNSKSAILFRAIDFIRSLEKRNRALRDKAAALEARVRIVKNTAEHATEKQSTLSRSSPSPAAFALEVHRLQQKQLLELQEKLQHHQKQIAKRQHLQTSARDEYKNLYSSRTYDERLAGKVIPKKGEKESLKTTVST